MMMFQNKYIIMKKSYTKQQIAEAIKHWEAVLKRMDESKSLLLDSCSKEFGEDVVFDSSKMLFSLNESNISKLFSILDGFIFESKLKTLDNLKIFVGSPSTLNKIILEYSNNNSINLSKYFALYKPDQYNFTLPNGEKRFTIKKNGIFINVETNKYSTFAYAASNICHEMIHVYDMYFGKLYNYVISAVNHGAPVEVIDYNSHKTSVFKQKKGEFETMTNIPIEDAGNDYSFEKFNEIASKDIALLKENDDLSKCMPYVFPKKIKDKYKDSNVVHFGDDGYFSFSFGIPMPK